MYQNAEGKEQKKSGIQRESHLMEDQGGNEEWKKRRRTMEGSR